MREIRPQFEGRLRGLWTIAGSCCNDRFPFISRARLQGQQESYLGGPSAGGPWAPPGRDTQARSVTNVLQLDTVTLDALDRLFFAGGSLDSLFEEFAIKPIVNGREIPESLTGAPGVLAARATAARHELFERLADQESRGPRLMPSAAERWRASNAGTQSL